MGYEGLAGLSSLETQPTGAIDQCVDFLLSRDPAGADYPMPARDSKPASAWHRLGFPIAYVTDLLQNLEVLAELGHARDRRLGNAIQWVEEK